MDDWTETMTARERVEAVATTLRRPRSVNWIKEEADAGSWETTRSELERLTESGQLRTVDREGDVRYALDPMRAYLDDIQKLVVENSKVQLRDELEAIATEIDTWKTRFDVESRAEFEATLGDERDPSSIRERRRVLRHWEENDRHNERISHALSLYDDLTSQDGPSRTNRAQAD